ncbi:hypothetical protein BH10BAC5_BH10BAC5_25840 [soil metagenome]
MIPNETLKHYKNKDFVNYNSTEIDVQNSLNNITLISDQIKRISENEAKKDMKLSCFIPKLYEYLENYVTLSTMKLYYTTMTEFSKLTGEKNLSEITVFDVENYKNVLCKRVKKITVNKNLKILRAAFNVAIEKMEILNRNPVNKVRLFKVEKKMIQYLQKSEIEIILNEIEEEYLKKIVLIGLYSGMRLGEILTLKWTDIDFINESISIQNKEEINYTTKNKNFRLLSLTNSLKKILGNPPGKLDTFIFLNTKGNRFRVDFISKKFKEYVRKVKLNELKFHYLRHTFATNCIKNRVPMYHLQKLLGHSSITVTMGYLHCNVGDIQTSMDKVAYGIDLES